MIVLDTHALIWWVTGDKALSKSAAAAIKNELAGDNGEIIISCISSWEIALLVERGKLVLSVDVETWLATVAEIKAVHFYPINSTIATKSATLPGDFHKDPADRMIVATARHFGAPLITKDEKISAYAHVKTIW